MSTSNVTLGIFADCITILVKKHEPTRTVLELIKQGFSNFVAKLNEMCAGEGTASQTGSSFDDLHLTRLLHSPSDKSVFYPPIDFDFMMIYMKLKLLDKSALQQTSGEAFDDLQKTVTEFAVMVPSEHPGYVRLLLTNVGRSELESRRPKCDFEKYISKEGFLPNIVFKVKLFPEQFDDTEILYKRQKTMYTSSGPAISMIENEPDGYTYDFVHSFPCEVWPEIAINWTRRPRPGKWPSTELIQDITQGGCAVVPVAHHLSSDTEMNLEWRVSFNAAERKLSTSFTSVQKSCFSIVKLMVKAGLSSKSILTSYHVKNMMFWFCEQMYGIDEWEQEFLGDRILQLLDYIANALSHHGIPSYFVPPNNLISHRSKEEINNTRMELILVRENIFQTFSLVCSKLQLFEEMKGLSNKTELQQMLILYTAFVQTIYKLGLINLSDSIAIRCFRNIVALNQSVKSYIKSASPAFAAISICQLLNPLATAYTQSGEIDNALRLYEIMLENERGLVESHYKDVYTNVACLFSYKYQSAIVEWEKQTYLNKAKDNFEYAVQIMKDSSSLHFAYGNFLLSIQSVNKALEEFKRAVAIGQPRTDDEAFIQLDVPGCESCKTHVTGKIAAFYLLCTCFVQLDDQYQARKYASNLEVNLRTSLLKHKYSDYQLCGLAYRVCGLHVKSSKLLNESKKFVNINKQNTNTSV